MYIKTTFLELEEKTKNTKWEGKKVHSYQEEGTGAPMVELELAKELKLKIKAIKNQSKIPTAPEISHPKIYNFNSIDDEVESIQGF
jgi:hypothetical protein